VGRRVGLAGSEMDPLPFYLAKGVSFVIEFDEVQCVDLIGIFPSVVTFGISFPFDEILQGPKTSLMPMGVDLIHFVFLFPFDQFGRRPGEVGAVCGSFIIG
jgi:hypothetical protein